MPYYGGNFPHLEFESGHKIPKVHVRFLKRYSSGNTSDHSASNALTDKNLSPFQMDNYEPSSHPTFYVGQLREYGTWVKLLVFESILAENSEKALIQAVGNKYHYETVTPIYEQIRSTKPKASQATASLPQLMELFTVKSKTADLIQFDKTSKSSPKRPIKAIEPAKKLFKDPCWNCGSYNHRHCSCELGQLKYYCYTCGKEGASKETCDNDKCIDLTAKDCLSGRLPSGWRKETASSYHDSGEQGPHYCSSDQHSKIEESRKRRRA